MTPPPPISRKNVKRRAQQQARQPHAPEPRPVTIPPPAPAESRAMWILRGAIGFAMVVAIGGGVAYGARRYVRTSERFAVSEIVTTGAKRKSPEELATIAGITKGQNVFSAELDRARARLLGDPWIEAATLSRQLPGTVFVHVKEREAAGLVASSSGDSYLVTRDGNPIKRLEAGDPTDFHVVTGITVQQMALDREGATRKIRRALDLAYDYEHSPLASGKPLEEIHVEPGGEMTLVVGKSAVELHMGAPPYRRKLEQAVRVVAELDRRGAKTDAVMLDNETRPDRVVVRMR